MGKIFQQVRTELRQLPFMLGKLLGGITTVIGFAAAIVIITRQPDTALSEILPAFFAGCAGIVTFILSARALTRRLAGQAEVETAPAHGTRTNMLSWGLLLLFVGIFLASTYFLTR